MDMNDQPLEPFVCWCGDEFESDHHLRKHQGVWCSVTRAARKRQEDKELEADYRKELAERVAALKAWKKEKASGPM